MKCYLLLLLWLGVASATLASADYHTRSVEVVRQQTAVQLRDLKARLPEFSDELPPAPAATGKVDSMVLFSSQSGSWSFEPFINKGLFQILAGYQSHHPRAILVKGGSLTLPQLAQRINDPTRIQPFKDGYLLSYPLIIAEDGALLLEHETLYLNTAAGSTIINLGQLRLNDSTISSWKGSKQQLAIPGFRPFIVGWAGSLTLIRDSELQHLGFNAHLSRGLTLALSEFQPRIRPALLELHNSELEDLQVGLELRSARARITHSRILNARQFGIDSLASSLELNGTTIQTTTHNSCVRVQGTGDLLLQSSQLLQCHKAGVELSDFSGTGMLADNLISQSAGHGILNRNQQPNAQQLFLDSNVIARNAGSAYFAEQTRNTWLLNNVLSENGPYAVSVTNAGARPGLLVLLDNQIGSAAVAGMRLQGANTLTMAANRFRLNAPAQPLFSGDLRQIQAPLLELLQSADQAVTVSIPVSH